MEKEKVEKRKAKGKVSEILISLLSVFVICLFPVAFLYAQNAAEAALADCLMPAALFCGIGAVLWLAGFLLTRNAAKSALAADLTMMLFLNFTLIENLALKINYEVRYWHVLAVLIVVVIQGSGLIFKKLPNSASQIPVQVISLVFSVLIVMNLVMAVPTMVSRAQAEKQTRANKEAQVAAAKSDGNRPNIYFLIFDEYAGNAQILKHYGYDNSPLTDRLASMGFNLSFTSHNESIITTTITTNLVNLDYVVDNTCEAFDKKALRVNGELFSLLKSRGYSLYGAVSADFYELPSIDDAAKTASNGTAKTAGGDTFGTILLKNTALYPMIRQKSDAIGKPVADILNFSANHSNDSQFVLAHFDFPHTPFIYDRDGNFLPQSSSDWHDKSLYLNQYIYAGKVMEELAIGIINNDPDSIVIIQSDHGARASTSQDLFMEIFELDEMNNIFNAVYCAGEEIEIDGLSGVNTLRTVLNRLFDMQMEMLPVPEDIYKYK